MSNVAIPILSDSTLGYSTYGTFNLVDGEATVQQLEAQSNSIIFLTCIANSSPSGQINILTITPLTSFEVNSTIRTGNNATVSYFRIQSSADSFTGTNHISLPYIIKSGSQQNIGTANLSGGSVTVSLPGQIGNSVVVYGRVNQPTNTFFGNITATFSGSNLTFTSTTSNEITKINYWVLPGYTVAPTSSTPASTIILDSTAGKETFGQISLVSGTVVVSTTACTTSSFVFVFAAHLPSSLEAQVFVSRQNNGNFTIGSNSTANTLVNWMIIN